MGCRQDQQKRRSNERSTEYNRSPAGREKKKGHNRRRSLLQGNAQGPIQAPPPPPPLTIRERYYGWLIRILAGLRLAKLEFRLFLSHVFQQNSWKMRQQGPDACDYSRYNRDD
ncbi:MAG: hypothetical protein EB060_10665 [Proteobacteria bacterium]|nr:hypothetical protein [Pseudomonadota bacterium]